MALRNTLQLLCALVGVVWVVYIFGYVSSSRPESPKLRSVRPTRPLFEDTGITDYRSSPAWKKYLMTASFKPSFTSVKANFGYCDLVTQYKRLHPMQLDGRGLPIRSERVVYNNYPNWYSVKKMFNASHPLVLYDYVDGGKPRDLAELPLEISTFFTMTIDFHKYFEIGRSFLCEGQRYNHIPGNVQLDSKIQSIIDLKEYSKYYAGRKQCFQLWERVPYTLLLDNYDDFQEFVGSLKANIESREIQWILKQGELSNQGVGVSVVDQALANLIVHEIEGRSSYSKFKGHVAQKYMTNPLLINGKKLDLRVYLLIASMDPLLVFTHDGYVKMALFDYDLESEAPVGHITNVHKTVEYLYATNHTTEQVSTLLNQKAWMFTDLEQYLLEQNLVKPGWMDTHFRRQIRETTLHVVRAGLHHLLRHPGVFEIFGMDFLVDDQLNLQFIELNYDPGIVNSSEGKAILNRMLLEDVMDIEYTLQFKPELLDEVVGQTAFQWVIDGRKQNIDRYNGLLSEDCL